MKGMLKMKRLINLLNMAEAITKLAAAIKACDISVTDIRKASEFDNEIHDDLNEIISWLELDNVDDNTNKDSGLTATTFDTQMSKITEIIDKVKDVKPDEIILPTNNTPVTDGSVSTKPIVVDNDWHSCVTRGTEGMFVNRSGQVKYEDEILEPYIDGYGFLSVKVLNKRFKPTFRVSDLVAEVFLKKIKTKKRQCISFKNRNRLDCSVDNLEWVVYGKSSARVVGCRNMPMEEVYTICEAIIKARGETQQIMQLLVPRNILVSRSTIDKFKNKKIYDEISDKYWDSVNPYTNPRSNIKFIYLTDDDNNNDNVNDDEDKTTQTDPFVDASSTTTPTATTTATATTAATTTQTTVDNSDDDILKSVDIDVEKHNADTMYIQTMIANGGDIIKGYDYLKSTMTVDVSRMIVLKNSIPYVPGYRRVTEKEIALAVSQQLLFMNGNTADVFRKMKDIDISIAIGRVLMIKEKTLFPDISDRFFDRSTFKRKK
jgi:hypothetical protein